jgi:hypothetical protein
VPATSPTNAALSIDEAKAEIAEFLESAPLYLPLRLKLSAAAGVGDLTPHALSLHCRKCADQETTTWTPTGNSAGLAYEHVEYACVRCKSSEIKFWLLIEPHPWRQLPAPGRGSVAVRVDAHTIRKVGQWPAWHDRIAADIERSLSPDDLELYKQASDCIRFGYGIGALAYFRRLIENTADTLLLIVKESAEAEGDAKLAASAAEARQGKDVQAKLKLVVGALPKIPRPGGVNPLQRLYDDYSVGIHRKSDEESLQTAADMKAVFDYVFKILSAHSREAKAFAEQLKRKK